MDASKPVPAPGNVAPEYPIGVLPLRVLGASTDRVEGLRARRDLAFDALAVIAHLVVRRHYTRAFAHTPTCVGSCASYETN